RAGPGRWRGGGASLLHARPGCGGPVVTTRRRCSPVPPRGVARVLVVIVGYGGRLWLRGGRLVGRIRLWFGGAAERAARRDGEDVAVLAPFGLEVCQHLGGWRW